MSWSSRSLQQNHLRFLKLVVVFVVVFVVVMFLLVALVICCQHCWTLVLGASDMNNWGQISSAADYPERLLCFFREACFFPLLFFSFLCGVAPSPPHVSNRKTQALLLFSSLWGCHPSLPHLAAGIRLQMPLWMMVAVLKQPWQVSTNERFCIELIKAVCSLSSHHLTGGRNKRWLVSIFLFSLWNKNREINKAGKQKCFLSPGVKLLFCSILFFLSSLFSFAFPLFLVNFLLLFLLLQGHGHHQVESHIRKKLDSLLKESLIGDKEDSDSFSIRALLRATHQGLQKNLRQVWVCVCAHMKTQSHWRVGEEGEDRGM